MVISPPPVPAKGSVLFGAIRSGIFWEFNAAVCPAESPAPKILFKTSKKPASALSKPVKNRAETAKTAKKPLSPEGILKEVFL